MPTLSIQEMVQKTEPQVKDIKRCLDQGYYDYSEANLFRIEGNPIGREDANNILETLRTIKLREFMAKSGTTGIAGAAYLIPDKIYQTLFDASVATDQVADISLAIVSDIPGSSLKVDIGVDGSYRAQNFSSGGKLPDEEIEVTQATITPTSFGIAPRITNDMIEDQNWDLMEWHLKNAGAEMGRHATNLAIAVLVAGSDGDGTQNTVTAYGDNTPIISIHSAVRMVVADEWQPDTMLGTTEAFLHSIYFPTAVNVDTGAYLWAYAKDFADKKLTAGQAVYGQSSYPSIFGLNPIETQSSQLYTAVTSNIMTNCITMVFDKSQSMLTGRKRWMRIEKYSDPLRDLQGAVVTARQDSVTVYDDAICKVSES